LKDLKIGGLCSSVIACAGSTLQSSEGATKNAAVVRAWLEFVTALCSALFSLPLLIICTTSQQNLSRFIYERGKMEEKQKIFQNAIDIVIHFEIWIDFEAKSHSI
jgi:hypothetical protein